MHAPSAGITQVRSLAVGLSALSAPNGAPAHWSSHHGSASPVWDSTACDGRCRIDLARKAGFPHHEPPKGAVDCGRQRDAEPGGLDRSQRRHPARAGAWGPLHRRGWRAAGPALDALLREGGQALGGGCWEGGSCPITPTGRSRTWASDWQGWGAAATPWDGWTGERGRDPWSPRDAGGRWGRRPYRATLHGQAEAAGPVVVAVDPRARRAPATPVGRSTIDPGRRRPSSPASSAATATMPT